MEWISVVQEILRRWDPIGIRPGEEGPGDEYNSYAGRLVSVVMRNCSLDDLCGGLETIRVEIIGVRADPTRDREIALEIVNALRDRGR